MTEKKIKVSQFEAHDAEGHNDNHINQETKTQKHLTNFINGREIPVYKQHTKSR